MKTILSIIVSGISIMGFASAIWADHHGDLAKSGTINYHTGFSCPSDMATTPEGIMLGTGTCTGVTYNDSGSGPLHMGAAQCHFSFFVNNGDARNKGYCFWSDADGDRIFTDFDGDPSANNGGGEGVNVLAGGTGKYEGISGSGPWKCTWLGADGELHCNQTFNYELP